MSGFIGGVDRDQMTLFPERLEDWIGEDHLVRVVDLFVDQLDLAELGFERAAHARPGWLEAGANLILFGPPGGGKTHLAAAIGLGLIENGWRVLFTQTTDLVQKLQVARRELALVAAITRLDKYHLIILDDLAYVTKDHPETSVLFKLISARY